MSPEQARGDLDRLGPLSDVYSLGATLYCLLTGKPPFEADDLGAVLRAVQRGEFPPPRKLDPSIDKALEAICSKAMALTPEDRYRHAQGAWPMTSSAGWPTSRLSAWREPWMRTARAVVDAAPHGRHGRRRRHADGHGGLGAVSGVQARANVKLNHANEALATPMSR